jgi:UDP-N-acetylmuramoylalanine--D-glutamate ligase
MSTDFADKRFLVLGAGVTGNSVAGFLRSQGGKVTLTDDNAADALKPGEVDLQNFDAAVISPGWRQDHPLVVKILNSSLELFNEIDLAWNLRTVRAPGQKWLAVTGTNGKTTTVEMTAAILKAAGIKATACGNVGDTVIDAVDSDDPYEVLVLELSSFQLHWARQAQFQAAAILNIADDHLDWHGSFDAYADAKFSILDRANVAILNADDGAVVTRANQFKDRKVFFSLNTPAPGEIGVVEELLVDRAFVNDPQQASMICELVDIVPTVPHNVSNALAAAGLARAIDVPHDVIQKALQAFRPGRHRIETIHAADGITWVDDSKATNPHATAASLMSHLSVVWIAGGLAKGADMDSMIQRCAPRIKAAILIGQDRGLIEAALIKHAPTVPRILIDSPADYTRGGDSNSLMESIVTEASKHAVSGDAVLLAPACASMDQFISYADRGDRFAAAVRKVIAHEA